MGIIYIPLWEYFKPGSRAGYRLFIFTDTMFNYLRNASYGKIVLWCYLLWYGVTVFNYFDPSIRIWLNSIGISVVIGFALLLSVSGPGNPVGNRWQTFRLFAMPFCVSSFSSLIKGKGFILVFPPKPGELAASIFACLLFFSAAFAIKRFLK
jgi:hypothetical protein